VTRSPAGDFLGALYHKMKKEPSAPEDGQNYCPKHVELIEITNKLLLLHLVGCLYYCIRDARSHKHQMYVTVRYVQTYEYVTCNSQSHWHISIIVQRDATQSRLFIILRVQTTCFGYQPHPSSGVHKTVTTASGTGHAVLCSYLPPTWSN